MQYRSLAVSILPNNIWAPFWPASIMLLQISSFVICLTKDNSELQRMKRSSSPFPNIEAVI